MMDSVLDEFDFEPVERPEPKHPSQTQNGLKLVALKNKSVAFKKRPRWLDQLYKAKIDKAKRDAKR